MVEGLNGKHEIICSNLNYGHCALYTKKILTMYINTFYLGSSNYVTHLYINTNEHKMNACVFVYGHESKHTSRRYIYKIMFHALILSLTQTLHLYDKVKKNRVTQNIGTQELT